MPARRLLIGPVDSAFAGRFLSPGDACQTFDATAGTWAAVAAGFPPGWMPDAVLVYADYTSIPAWVWAAPAPVVALAHDPNLLWHATRTLLPLADLVLTDRPAAARLARAGVAHARPANLYGLDRHFLAELDTPDGDRDIDVLFVGNLNPAVQGERLGWLGRLAALADRHWVVIRTGVYGADYRALLRRAKVVFNRSIRGECNKRALEAAAAGAVLFQEAENQEVPFYLEPGTEYVPYTATDLEDQLARCLADEPGRRAMANRARARVRGSGWLDLIQAALAACAPDWPEIRARAARRAAAPPRPGLAARVWQRAGLAGPDADPTLAADLAAARADHALALLAATPAAAEPHLARAAAAGNRVSAAGHAAALRALGRTDEAMAAARRVLAALAARPDLSAEELGTCPYPRRFDPLRVGWEQAGWDHPDDPAAEAAVKHVLLRCWTHALVAGTTGDRDAYAAAAALRPDLPAVRAAYGCALARAGRFAAAVDQLGPAVAANPFDGPAAAALVEALADDGRAADAETVRAARRRLARAAPGLVSAPAAPGPTRGPDPARLAIAWDGEFEPVHSLAGVNRAACAELLARGHQLALVPVRTTDVARVDLPPELAALVGRPLPGRADAYVRHRWPVDPTPPAGGGAFVLVPPWEFGRVPRAWVDGILAGVDEVWAYSRAVARAFVASGVPADRVAVVPPGVDPDRFRPGLDPLPLATAKRVKLLFVGGTIWRKGIDVLLAAYRRAFTAADDVCLVIQEGAAGGAYRGQTAGAAIAAFRADPVAPAVEYRTEHLTEADLARLYAACDALVLPYRGEGFGLPVLEGMAGGLPVVVTAGGPTDEFVPPAAGWRVAARRVELPDDRVGGLATAGRAWHLEPDPADLAAVLRAVAADQAERARRGAAGRRAALGWTWARTAAAVEDRVRELRGRTPVRFRRPADDRDGSEPRGAVAPADDPTAPLVLRSDALPAARPRVSLCLIVRDEEDNLRACVGPVRDLVDEVVVVDTGSTDRTREVARDLGATVVEFPWVDSFSAARNESVRHATGDWVFWLDADDRVDDENRAALARVFATLPAGGVAYVMKCVCVPADPGGPATVVDHVRLFPNDPRVRWTYRVHEQVLPALRRAGADVRWADVVIRHVGYTDPAVRRRKLDRDLRLLRLDQADRPEDPFTLFNLGSVYNELGDVPAALAALERSLALSHPTDSIVRKLSALIAHGRRELGDRAGAGVACRAGREHYPDDAELLFLEGNLLREAGDLGRAEQILRRLVGGREGAHFASVDTGLRGYKGRHNLAVVLSEQGRWAEAAAEWRAAAAEAPAFLPARIGLAEAALRAGDVAALARELDGLAALGPSGERAAVAIRTRASGGRGAG